MLVNAGGDAGPITLFFSPGVGAPARQGATMTDPIRFAHHRTELEKSLLAGEQKLQALMQGPVLELAAGKTLVRAGGDHEYVYRMVSGWACRVRTLTDGRDQLILVFLPGELFAVKSMFMSCHFDNIRILADSVVQRIHYKDLHEAFIADPDIANRCIWQVVEEERRLHSWVFGLGQGSAEERLALLMIDFRGRLALAGAIARDALTYPMPLTQTQLADHLGITPVHVNRLLKSFRENGILAIREGEVVIMNLDELTQRAYPLLDAYERKTPEYVGPQGRSS
jgi:CRP/FNR family transcriptional regulator, anaerobic regulatory protein